MDHKELINRLREKNQSWAAYNDQSLAWALDDAATAIETLLAERDALMGEIKGRCAFCANMEVCAFDVNARKDCKYLGHFWKWRGPTPPDREKEELKLENHRSKR